MFASRSDLMVRTRTCAWVAASSFLLLLALALLLPAPAAAQRAKTPAPAKASTDTVTNAGSQDEGISVRVFGDGKQGRKHARTARERANAAPRDAAGNVDETDKPEPPEPPEPPDDHSNDLVRFGQDIVIPADKVIEGSVVTLGGAITVYGRVKGDCTAVGGSVSVRDSAVVEGNAVSVGGTTSVSDGARVQGSNVSVGPWPFHGAHAAGMIPFLGLMGLGALAGIFTNIAQILVTMLFAWLCLLLARERMLAAVARMESQFGKSFLWGLVAWMAMIVVLPAICIVGAIAIVILTITIIGIPIAILLAIAMVFALIGALLGIVILAFLGYIQGAMFLGRKFFARKSPGRVYKPIWEITAGLLLIVGMKLIGNLLGLLGIVFIMPIGIALGIASVVLMWVFMTTGMGAIVLTRFSKHPAPYATAPGAPAPPPGAAAAGWYAPPSSAPPSTKPSPEGGSSDAP